MRVALLSLGLLLALDGDTFAQMILDKGAAEPTVTQTAVAEPKAADAKPKQNWLKFIGEEESYTHPDGSASDAMETISRQQGGNGTFGEVNIPGTTNDRPKPPPLPEQDTSVSHPISDLAPSDPVPPEILGITPRRSRRTESASSGVDAPASVSRIGPLKQGPVGKQSYDKERYSLWEGLAAPLELPGGKVSDVSAAAASALGRKDYDSHILGIRSADGTGAPLVAAGRSFPIPEQGSDIFVNFNLDFTKRRAEESSVGGSETLLASLRPGPEENLKDALGALSTVAGFRPDPRFQTKVLRGKVSLWGWMPVDKINAAMQVPSVTRLEIKKYPNSASGPSLSESQILVGIRISGVDTSDGIPAGSESEVKRQYASVLRRLGSEAGFVIKRTIGYQVAPGSSDLVIVAEGRVPIRNLSKVMAHRAVVKVAPVPVWQNKVTPRASMGQGFVKFATARSPLLIAVTILLLIPSVGSWFLRMLETLVPYRRV